MNRLLLMPTLPPNLTQGERSLETNFPSCPPARASCPQPCQQRERGGGSGDPFENGEDLTSLLGKVDLAPFVGGNFDSLVFSPAAVVYADEVIRLSQSGTFAGPLEYAAPEQVRGEEVDARSDIFSLGCVLYEMASGRRAFTGNTGAEVIASILKEEPPQLSSSGASVPVDLERAVHRCLEKRPEARFQSAADLAYSLKSVGLSGTAPIMATTLIVRPVSARAPMTPIAPSGRVKMMTNGWRNDSNCDAMTR